MATTAFEDSGGSAWTTYAQELSYVAAILSEHPTRLAKVPLATSTQGREVYALRVGAAGATGAPLLLDVSIHGDEPAPREAGLTLARDMAATADAALVALLDEHPLYIVCPNPDGRVANVRGDSTGQDLNRAHFGLIRPETKAFAELVRDLQPMAGLSGHEVGVSPNVQMNPTISAGISPGLYYGSYAYIAHAAFPQTVEMGETPSFYVGAPTGVDNDWSRTSGAKGILLALVETFRGGTKSTRVGWHQGLYLDWLHYVAANAADIERAARGARREVASRVARGVTAWPAVGFLGTPLFPATALTNVTATGYVVTAAQWASTVTSSAPAITVAQLFASHGITTYPYGADRWVPLGQPLAPLIVRMIDPSATNEVIQATRVATTPEQFARPGDLWAAVA